MGIPSFSLKDKVAIITGGRIGLGKAFALAFAEAGADVAICSRTGEDELETVADEIRRFGRHALAIKADVSIRTDVENMVKRTVAELGEIDILVNNAGFEAKASLLETSEKLWDEVMNINLKGCYLCCQEVGKRMVKRKRGSIINNASASGIRPIPYRAAYATSKGAMITLTQVFAQEVAQYNVRVNAIATCFVKTKMLDEALEQNPARVEKMLLEIPMGRLLEVDDLIGTALFLASDASLSVTGHTLVVDGGYLAGDYAVAK